MNKLIKKIVKVVVPIALGAFFLYRMYSGFDFEKVKELLCGLNWWWMIVSLFFGVFSHILRGWRWMLTLSPINCHPKRSDCVDAIFVSYAANLIIPRIGEVSRCGVLKSYDNIPFSKSLGTVVTERLLDMACMGVIALVTILMQLPLFTRFFQETGAKIPTVTHLFHSVWFYILLFCFIGVIILAYYLLRALSFFQKVKGVALNIWEGICSLRNVQSIPLFVLYTIGIWLCYFFHFYLTFFCFGFTSHLSVMAAMVMFVGGTVAVLVPTPNGAGPWHFAVITMMMMYGVDATDAGAFALIVHSIQTLLVIVLGIWGWLHLMYVNKVQVSI